MTDPNVSIPTRAPSQTSEDDTILPFEVPALDLRGRVVRLGPAVDEILARHDYPAPVAKVLGEAIVLASLLGSSLKFKGRFILQTQTDGPVRMLVVDFVTPAVKVAEWTHNTLEQGYMRVIMWTNRATIRRWRGDSSTPPQDAAVIFNAGINFGKPNVDIFEVPLLFQDALRHLTDLCRSR